MQKWGPVGDSNMVSRDPLLKAVTHEPSLTADIDGRHFGNRQSRQ